MPAPRRSLPVCTDARAPRGEPRPPHLKPSKGQAEGEPDDAPGGGAAPHARAGTAQAVALTRERANGCEEIGLAINYVR